MPDRRLDASALLDWAGTAVGDLIVHADEINRLNVFPVADSDTGTNMLFTMRSALARANASAESDPLGRDPLGRVATALADGALDGARGNSGIILSQILRAFAEVTVSAAEGGTSSHIDARLFADALNRSVTLVVSAMGGEVVAGTVVSVLQAAAAAAAAGAGAALADVATAVGAAAAEALDKTPQQLEVLAQAGVVDAGGRGLLVLLDSLTATVGGHRPERRTYEPGCRTAVLDAAPPQFEVMYLLGGCESSAAAALRTRLEKLGNSVVIAASGTQLSVHVHTDDAGGAIEAGLMQGEVSKVQISVLSTGPARSTAPARTSPGSWKHQRTVLAVVDGDGAAQLFSQEGANVVTPDPELLGSASGLSARQLLRALIDADAAQVLVLPNGYVAAEELVATCTAGIGWGIDVVPLPSGSMVQGLAALAVHDPGSEAVDDAYTMARAAGAARCGSVRIATEKALTWAGTCEPGDGLGIAGDEVLIVDRDVATAGSALIDLFLSAGGELVTVLVGAEADPRVADQLAEHVRRTHLGVEFAGYVTGQRGDALLIGVE
ncbi:MAG: DAK2 domain-containing protein [Mycobacterium sp.]